MLPAQIRPGYLTLIGILSLTWSLISLVGVAFGTVVVVAYGSEAWLKGVWVIDTFFLMVFALWLFISLIFSVHLSRAGWKTLRDDPAGIRLHRLWAWCSIGIDIAALILSAGNAPFTWFGDIYAGCILYVTNLPEVRAYLGKDPMSKPAKPLGWADDLA